MSKRALVVDNDFFFVEFLTDLLEPRGYEVIKAYDGKEGITKLEQYQIDLLVVDIIMPKIDGKQLIEFTRKKFPDAPFPIIAVSGTIIEQLDQIQEIGADYFLQKGPLERMTGQFTKLMDTVERGPVPSSSEKSVFEPETLYPRQETMELIDSANFYRAISECLGVGILVADKDARIIVANPMVLDILNRSIATALNRPVLAMFPEKEKQRVVAALKRILQKPDLKKITFSVVIQSQKMLVNVSLLRLGGEISGYIIALEETGQWVEQA